MVLDPRTLTPAAARSMFLRNQTGLPGPREQLPPAMAPVTLPLQQRATVEIQLDN